MSELRSDPEFGSSIPTFDSWPSPSPAAKPPELLLRGQTIPGVVHTLLFFALAVIVLLSGELITVGIGRRLPAFRHEDFATLAGDARLMIPAQALQYAILLALTALIFGFLWRQPFWKAIRWNFPAAAGHWIALIGLGLLLGLGTSVAGNYLPMPKEAPILNDLMHSTTGAWLMFVFGTTGAPLVEELGFRGFLLPSLINLFRCCESRRMTLVLTTPLSILLTTLPFALLHSLQVSYAWAPVTLIGMVSVALCIIRVWTDSLAASTLVHAAYNFSLFAGMLVASDGFRHLEKLNN